MIGIDTNVLLRLLVRDDEAQVRAAERFFATHCSPENPGFVSLIVIVETAWANPGEGAVKWKTTVSSSTTSPWS